MMALDSSFAASSGVGGLTLITRSDFHTYKATTGKVREQARDVKPPKK